MIRPKWLNMNKLYKLGFAAIIFGIGLWAGAVYNEYTTLVYCLNQGQFQIGDKTFMCVKLYDVVKK